MVLKDEGREHGSSAAELSAETKPLYETPRLVSLGADARGVGAICVADGSGDGTCVGAGTSAGGDCDGDGSSAGTCSSDGIGV